MTFSVTFLKILEYCERDKKEGAMQTPGADAGDLNTGEIDKYALIAAEFGMDDMEISESRRNEQSLEQEYQAYITALLLSKTINILKFWEVADLLIIFQYY